MRKFLMLAVTVAFLPTAARADEAAVKVVKKAIEAHGGEKALTAVKAGEATIKAAISVAGTEIEFEGETAFEFPDKMSVAMSAEVMGQKIAIVQVLNGDKLKMTVNGNAAPLDDKQKDEIKQGLVSQQLGFVVALLDKKFTLVADKDENANGEDAAVVRVSANGYKDTKLFFSKKTGLLVRSQRQGLDSAGGEVDTVSDVSDYKKVDGVLTPTTITVTQDGKKFMTMTLSDKKFRDKPNADRKFNADE